MTRTDPPVTRPEPTGPVSGQVRIVGAEPAGETTAELPLVPARRRATTARWRRHVDTDGIPDSLLPVPPGRGRIRPADGAPDRRAGRARGGGCGQARWPRARRRCPAARPPSCPTGPSRRPGRCRPSWPATPGDETATGIAGPSWREEESDWVAHDELFEPGVFGEEEVAIGSLDETDRTDVERRPWEFDLDLAGRRPAVRADTSPVDPITEPVEWSVARPSPAPGDRGQGGPGDRRRVGVRRRGGRARRPGPLGAAERGPSGAAAPGGGTRRPFFPTRRQLRSTRSCSRRTRPSPTGSARMGRARRSGLLPARLRAKRPEEGDELAEAPLAAEPPGASVTDVPGAGRKRRGLAGLAAADRTAEREGGAGRGAGRRRSADRAPPGPTRSARRRRVRAPAVAAAVARGPTAGPADGPRRRQPEGRVGDRGRAAGTPGPATVGPARAGREGPPGRAGRCSGWARGWPWPWWPSGVQVRHRPVAGPGGHRGHLRRR